jgi:hypothetical protein
VPTAWRVVHASTASELREIPGAVAMARERIWVAAPPDRLLTLGFDGTHQAFSSLSSMWPSVRSARLARRGHQFSLKVATALGMEGLEHLKTDRLIPIDSSWGISSPKRSAVRSKFRAFTVHGADLLRPLTARRDCALELSTGRPLDG